MFEEKQWERKSKDDDLPWWKTEIEQWQSRPFSILDAEGTRLFVDNRAIRFDVEPLLGR